MERTERFYKICDSLKARRAVSTQEFLDELEISLATFKRDIEYLKDRYGAPIIWDRNLRGYRFDYPSSDSPKFELPGLWFNASEMHALLVMEHLLENMQPGLLAPHIGPMGLQIRSLIEKGDHAANEVLHRIRFLPSMKRKYDLKHCP